MDRRQTAINLGLSPNTYVPAPVAPDHRWPQTTNPSTVHRTISPSGRQTVTVTPPISPVLGPTAAPQNAQLSTPAPGSPDWIPLCTISELQDMLLVKHREDGARGTGDTHTIRQRPRVERLPPDPPTPEKLVIYLQELENCGTHHEAARRARLTYRPIHTLRRAHPELEALVQEALERYRERLEREAYRRGVEGWDVPMLGGQFKDRIVANERKYDSRMLELMLKRHIPEYREKFEGELKITGGVLVVPAPALSAEAWAKEHGGEQRPALPEIVADSPPSPVALPP